MALPIPNTDPRKGRPSTSTDGKLGAGTDQTTEVVKGLDDIEDVISKRLEDISKFLEKIANYAPKLGHIEKNTDNTQGLRLRDQILPELKQLNANVMLPEDEKGDGERQDGAGGDGPPPDAEKEEKEAPETLGEAVKQIAEDVRVIKDAILESQEGLPDGGGDDVPPHTHDDGDKDGDDESPEGPKKKKGGFMDSIKGFLKMLKSFILGALLLLAPLMTASNDLFSKIKELFSMLMGVFQQLLGIFFEQVVPVITKVLMMVMDVFMMLIDALMPVVEQIVPPIMALMETIMMVVMQVVEALMPVVEMLLDLLVPIINHVVNVLMFIFDKILGPVLAVLVPVIEFVADLARMFFNFLISMFNGLLEGIAFLVSKIPFVGEDAAESLRAMKIDPIEKDESDEAAKNIDFSQDDEAIEAQIQAKVDSGEINETTAESLRKDKEKFAEEQAARRKQQVEKLKPTGTVEVPDALKGDDLDLVGMDLTEVTEGAMGKVLIDRGSRDEEGNYDLYKEDGTPIKAKGPIATAVQMAAHEVVESLNAQEIAGADDSMDMSNLGAAFGQPTGSDIADETGELDDAQMDDGGGGSSSTTTVSNVTTQNNQQNNSQQYSGGGGSPTSGRGVIYGGMPN